MSNVELAPNTPAASGSVWPIHINPSMNTFITKPNKADQHERLGAAPAEELAHQIGGEKRDRIGQESGGVSRNGAFGMDGGVAVMTESLTATVLAVARVIS